MMRVVRVVSYVLIGVLVLAARGQAQTPAAAPAAGTADTSRFFVAADFGATFGHKSSGSLGAEGGVQVSGPISVYVEGGHMFNVGTEDLDARAQKIANAVGATSSASYHINYFDIGVRYSPSMAWKAKPYILGGVGVAQVTAETVLAVNGTPVPPESLGVQFGTDLDGTTRKVLFVFGGGATYPITQKIFVDGSFRYGRIFPKTSEIENDTAINTARLQGAVGFRF